MDVPRQPAPGLTKAMRRSAPLAVAVAIGVAVVVYAVEVWLIDRGAYPEDCRDTVSAAASYQAPRPALWVPLALGVLAAAAVLVRARMAAAPGRNAAVPPRDA